MRNIWMWFLSLFTCGHCCKKTSGNIVLGFGVHEIAINVKGMPCKVNFNIEDPMDGHCVCHGDTNKIGITIGKCGFVIHADIKTNTCLIEWCCDYKEC